MEELNITSYEMLLYQIDCNRRAYQKLLYVQMMAQCTELQNMERSLGIFKGDTALVYLEDDFANEPKKTVSEAMRFKKAERQTYVPKLNRKSKRW